MQPYQNLGGDSNIESYEITEDSIHVVFKSGQYRNYLYNHVRPGKMLVDRMKVLAAQGYGLNSYINENVGEKYAERW